ncbi:hypothetical protein BaRGS_00007962 [Batillaria attramentaria]|uniref:Uncharacterized protein n=1 Tax=Batillaria attramentaria TaxID=370345 RepID=A0ABD0LNZ4_9CAEN
MAFKLSVWLLVLVVSGGCFMSTASPLGAETTREDIDIVVNGEMVHERRETDGTCRHAKNTATLADGSSSTSYEDMDSGLVLVQISNDTDTCYVKEISQDEKDEAKTCKDGTVSRSLRDLCAGKKIVSMVPAANSDSDVYSQCTHSVLTVYSQCSHSVLTVYLLCSHSVLTVYSQCTHSVLTVFSQCTHSVLTVFSQCTHSVLTVYSQCTHSVLTVFSQCTHSVLTVFSQCTHSVLTVYSQCTYCVLTVYSQCTHSVLTVFSQCTHSVLTVYSQCTYCVLTVYSQCTHSVLTVYLLCSHSVLTVNSHCTGTVLTDEQMNHYERYTAPRFLHSIVRIRISYVVYYIDRQ